MTKPVSFSIVGGASYRAAYYLRIAQALPEWFRVAGLLVRDPATASATERLWGVPTRTDLDSLLECGQSDFVVVSVSASANPQYMTRLAKIGVPVLVETPPAIDLAGLVALHDELVEQGARIQVAEQYQFHPLNQARMALISDGRLGPITQATVSFSQTYHAVSLLRKLLGVAFDDVRITAMRFDSDVVEGPGRAGPPTREAIIRASRELAWLDFGDKLGIYDYTVNQHRSWIRSNHVSVRGVRGEIFDRRVNVLQDFATALPLELQRVNRGEWENQEGYYLQGIMAGDRWVYENEFAPARLYDDELAIATCLRRMADYVRGGPEFYGLAEASQDTYLGLLIGEAIATGTTVTSTRQPWAG